MRTRIWHSDWNPRWLIRCVSAALLSFMDKQETEIHLLPTHPRRQAPRQEIRNPRRCDLRPRAGSAALWHQNLFPRPHGARAKALRHRRRCRHHDRTSAPIHTRFVGRDAMAVNQREVQRKQPFTSSTGLSRALDLDAETIEAPGFGTRSKGRFPSLTYGFGGPVRSQVRPGSWVGGSFGSPGSIVTSRGLGTSPPRGPRSMYSPGRCRLFSWLLRGHSMLSFATPPRGRADYRSIPKSPSEASLDSPW